MSHHNDWKDLLLTRRQLLGRMGNGFAALGLAGVLADQAAADGVKPAHMVMTPLTPKAPPLPAKAKRVIFLFMNGGPS
ncbi:MAG: hypothetical protein JWN14_1057, partial [Chthonomonadales bacterium]|nr:hypothetical protein [Chthonomonadales bacterium]